MSTQTTAAAGPRLAIGDSTTITIEAWKFWNDTGIYLVAGQEYEFTAEGTWTDWFIPCGADGFASPNLAMMSVEWMRRAPRERWFALIGAVGHDPETQFLIGKERVLPIPANGMLACFANDTPFAYWNNAGSLRLTVRRLR